MAGDPSAPDLASIPPAVLAGVLERGRREGLAVSSWFSGTGVDPALLYAPGARVSLLQAGTILRRAIEALPGRPLGIGVGKRDTLLSFGFLGVAMRASETVDEGLHIAEDLPTRHRPTQQSAIEMCRQLQGPGEAQPDTVTSVEALVGGKPRRPPAMSDVADRANARWSGQTPTEARRSG